MALSPGFRGRRRAGAEGLPPGQYLTTDFPVLSAGPTPRINPARWEFFIRSESGAERTWSWPQFLDLPTESPTVDLHCVTKWSKLGTSWQGVPVAALLAEVETAAEFAMVHSYGGYTTNVPVTDLLDGKSWVVHRYDGADLRPEHGGPARLLVPHLYLWKSAKWVRGIELMVRDEPGFWEGVGYHNYGDPWREQRYQGD